MPSPNKQRIIASLLHALCHNILGDHQLRSRIIGFRGELDFRNFIKKWPIRFLHGGMFVPNQKGSPALESTIYYTLIPNEKDLTAYLEVYQKIAMLQPLASFLITYHLVEEKEKKNFLPSVFQFYQFQNDKFIRCEADAFFEHYQRRKKAYNPKPMPSSVIEETQYLLSPYNTDALLQLYVERFFFDFCLSAKYITGISSDLDIIYKKNRQIRFGEVKEKYLAKAIKGFGLDLHRSKDLYTIHQKTQTPYYIFVKEVDKSKDRNFIAWHSIEIQDFVKHSNSKIIEGGTGMRSKNSNNPTTICALEHFREMS